MMKLKHKAYISIAKSRRLDESSPNPAYQYCREYAIKSIFRLLNARQSQAIRREKLKDLHFSAPAFLPAISYMSLQYLLLLKS